MISIIISGITDLPLQIHSLQFMLFSGISYRLWSLFEPQEEEVWYKS